MTVVDYVGVWLLNCCRSCRRLVIGLWKIILELGSWTEEGCVGDWVLDYGGYCKRLGVGMW